MGYVYYYVFYIIFSVGISCIFGAITKTINEKKGRDGGFAWGFWLGWIGIIVVACRPSEERYVPASRNDWNCPCGRSHPQYIATCGTCGYTREKAMAAKNALLAGADPTGSWRCVCGRVNGNYMTTCVCGVSRRAVVRETPAPTKPTAAISEKERLELLREYKELLDSGILTQEEFDTKKKQLLADDPQPARVAAAPQERFCPQCGTKQAGRRQTCFKCGAAME